MFVIILIMLSNLKYFPALTLSCLWKLLLYFFNWRIIALQCCVSAAQQHEPVITTHTHTHTHPLSLLTLLLLMILFLTPPHPTPLSHHRAPGWASCVIWQLPTRYCFAHGSVYMWTRKWQPTPVFLPGESLEHGSLGGCLWGHTESDTTEAT